MVLDPVFACNECAICQEGHANVCANVKCYGVQMDGGYQDYIVVEERHLYTFDPSRITSYNVCYTKLLRYTIKNGLKDQSN